MRISLGSACDLYRALDTPRSLTCFLLVKYKEWDQLATLAIDPANYLCDRDLLLDAQATDYLRKHATLPTSFDRARKARDNFMDMERLCAQTNLRFLRLNSMFFEHDSDERIWQFCRRVRKEIGKVLGGVPHEVFPRFGPGATFSDQGRLTTVADKMVSIPTVTPYSAPFLDMWSQTAWGREYLRRPEKAGRIKFTSADRFTTVPKDAKTDRSIAIQPSINILYQLGVGSAMRQRLAKWGIDLTDGQDTHRRVACEASMSGLMSTIDLSSASDTISSEVVKALMPTDWYDLLCMLRTTHTQVRKDLRLHLQKFSAMGNGFTFELETTIFAALIKVTLDDLGMPSRAGRDFYVYGDDMIVSREATRAVLSVLRYFGFIPNPKKTFTTGSFRESCGGDYFDGGPVRAHFLKDEPNEPHEIIALANGLRRFIERFNPFDKIRRRLVKVWFAVLDSLPSHVRALRGPASLGDLVIQDSRGWRVRGVHKDRSRKEICVWQPIESRLPLYHWPFWAQYAGALYGVDSQGITPRGAVQGYRKAWVALIERPM
jgi:hypothetical protein